MTIGKKLLATSTASLAITVLIAYLGYHGIMEIHPEHSPLMTQISALRSSMAADMMHDALRGDALRAILAVTTGDTTYGERSEIENDVASHSETLTTEIKSLRELDLPEDIKKLVDETEPAALEYVNSATTIVEKAYNDPKAVKDSFAEFGQSFSALETTLEALGKAVETKAGELKTEAIGHADGTLSLTVILSVVGCCVMLGLSFYVGRGIVNAIRQQVRNLSSTATELKATAQSLAGSSAELTSKAAEQAAAVQESAAAIQEISSMLDNTKSYADDSVQNVELVTQKTESGSRVLDSLASQMQAIEVANANLNDIVRIIEDISSKTGVINDIVFKTQLLSFNASIEAARAGHHGKGFAVVAEEVGNLAEMSGEAARDIQGLLGDSKSRVNTILAEINTSTQHGNTVTKDALASFKAVATQIDSVHEQLKRINDAAREQASAVTQVTIGINNTDQVMRRNGELARSTSTQAAHLLDESRDLERVMNSLQRLVESENAHPAVTTKSQDWYSSEEDAEENSSFMQ